METKQIDPQTVLVFETNIRHKKDLSKVANAINTETRITKWNVDLTDCDRILRIESSNLHPNEIVQLLTNAGYSCHELQD